MKLAPWVAASAIALFLGTLAVSDRPPRKSDPPTAVALDALGIDTLVVERGDPTVAIGPGPMRAEFRHIEEGDFTSRRDGDTLFVALAGPTYREFRLTVPTSVRVVELDDGTVEAAVPLDTIELRTHGDVDWKGDVQALRVRQTRRTVDTACDHEPECQPDVTVHAGAIGHADVALRTGTIRFEHPGQVQRYTLALGSGAGFALGRMKRSPAIEPVPLDVSVLPMSRIARRK